MKKHLVLFLMLGMVFNLYGCASSVMTKAPSQELKPPSAGKAQVVFMRSSIVAAAISAELFEVVDGELKFIGVISNGTKVVHETSPGKKVYMAYGMAADFMLADVQAGKTYFSIVRPNWGTGGFAPTPIRKQGGEWNMQTDDFKSWLSNTDLVIPNAEAKAYFEEKKADFQKIYTEYWSRFQGKSANEKAERTLNPEDGR